MTNTYRFAERNVEITSRFAAVHKRCRAYETRQNADFSVSATEQDIALEREMTARKAERDGAPLRSYSDAYLEAQAIHRKIIETMPFYNTVMFHGSCIAVDGVGYIFAAPSGTGKSTHARLWKELLGEHAVMVNDDKPLIRVEEEGATVFGTPWDGKHRLSSNIAVPLKTICELTRSAHNAVEPISLREAFHAFLQQVYLPLNKAAYVRTVELLAQLVSSVAFCRLRCTMDPDAARIAYEALK